MESSSASSSTAYLKFCKTIGDDNDGTENSENSQCLSSDTLLRKMFESQSGDWEMVASDGEIYKFHKDVLKEQVARFRAIFAHPSTKEHLAKQIIVPSEVEMSGPAVEAFLRYAYYHDTAPMESSLEITCALIRAGHYYDVPKIVDAANIALRSNGVLHKKMDWLKFEDLWELYQHVYLWEENHPSRKKLMENLVAIIKESFKNNSSSAKACSGSGPLVDLISKLVQEQPSLPPAPRPRSASPFLPPDNMWGDNVWGENVWGDNEPEEINRGGRNRGRRGSRNRNRYPARGRNSNARVSNDVFGEEFHDVAFWGLAYDGFQ